MGLVKLVRQKDLFGHLYFISKIYTRHTHCFRYWYRVTFSFQLTMLLLFFPLNSPFFQQSFLFRWSYQLIHTQLFIYSELHLCSHIFTWIIVFKLYSLLESLLKYCHSLATTSDRCILFFHYRANSCTASSASLATAYLLCITTSSHNESLFFTKYHEISMFNIRVWGNKSAFRASWFLFVSQKQAHFLSIHKSITWLVEVYPFI